MLISEMTISIFLFLQHVEGLYAVLSEDKAIFA
jgi:hypothetical protein